ncbi:hypothetical protein BCR33DRAFT_714793 [Rhizoclosmatium globosum]|uniref:MYND-type domain-containing protein n=1 Tax=Rhizoclosmatium globosum TaxID=329046 RepID=A0A1Y2CL18_9FUNG|nr:hypothetical protein BCR33DRAFT_714793 [Rhizoclosmatium globosum]|eukprot:ORY47711.1 hypothetical protein BCR33DRAFT_714793 [Rhizoclosmatium globosum]
MAFLSTVQPSPDSNHQKLMQPLSDMFKDRVKAIARKGDTGKEYFEANVCLAGLAQQKGFVDKGIEYCEAAIASKFANESSLEATLTRARVNQMAGRMYLLIDYDLMQTVGKLSAPPLSNKGVNFLFEATKLDPLLYGARACRVTYLHFFFFNPKALKFPKEEEYWNLTNYCEILEKQLEAKEVPYCMAIGECFQQFAYHLKFREEAYKAGQCDKSQLVPGHTSRDWFIKSLQVFSQIGGNLHENEIGQLGSNFEYFAKQHPDVATKYKSIIQLKEAEFKNRCAECGNEKALKRCAGCLMMYFCSTECQKANWKKEHKVACKMMKKVVDSSPLSKNLR